MEQPLGLELSWPHQASYLSERRLALVSRLTKIRLPARIAAHTHEAKPGVYGGLAVTNSIANVEDFVSLNTRKSGECWLKDAGIGLIGGCLPLSN